MTRLFLPVATKRSTLLPFLYQTRTIRSPTVPSSRAQRCFHISKARKARNATSHKTSDPIPFEGAVDAQGNDDQTGSVEEDWPEDDPATSSTGDSTSRPLRNSTITASEKAVFERIFKEISDDASKKAVQEHDPLENNLDDDEVLNSDVYSELNEIFDKAISKTVPAVQRNPSVGADKKHPDQISRNFMTAIDAFGGASNKIRRIFIARGSEDEQKIQSSVVEHSRKVMKKIMDAKTDTEIWNVLETDVFILIKQQDSQKKILEEQNKPAKRKRGGSISNADKEAAAAKEKKQSLRVREKSFQQAEIEAILSSNYGDYCLAAMRNLRRAYPASPYAMNLLPTVKSLGSISHVLAASVDLYNEVLFLLWSQYSDLNGMADLIDEMGNQGIESNEITLKILRMVQFAKAKAFREDKPMKLWWTLGPVVAGWTKMRRNAVKVHFEILQAKARRAMEGDLAKDRDLEPEMQMDQDHRQETSSEKDLRVKRDIAHQATIMHGGLHRPVSSA